MREAVEAGDEAGLARMLSERGLFGRRMAKAEWEAFAAWESGPGSEESGFKKGHTMLMAAARAGQAGIARKLIGEGADPGARDKEGRTALMWAARGGKAEAIDALIAAGADANAKDSRRKTALHWAAEHGKAGAIEALLRGGASPGEKDLVDKTALARAAEGAGADAIAALAAGGADLSERMGAFGGTALHMAAASGNLGALRGLLEAGLDREARDSEGQTALMEAARKGWDAGVRELIKAGADLGARDKRGEAPFRPGATLELIRAGADLEEGGYAKSPEGLSALDMAERAGAGVAASAMASELEERKIRRGGGSAGSRGREGYPEAEAETAEKEEESLAEIGRKRLLKVMGALREDLPRDDRLLEERGADVGERLRKRRGEGEALGASGPERGAGWK